MSALNPSADADGTDFGQTSQRNNFVVYYERQATGLVSTKATPGLRFDSSADLDGTDF